MIRHTLDLAALTVIASDQHGNVLDMTEGAQLQTPQQLRAFIAAACKLGAFSSATRDQLIRDTFTDGDTRIGLSPEGRCVADVLAARGAS